MYLLLWFHCLHGLLWCNFRWHSHVRFLYFTLVILKQICWITLGQLRPYFWVDIFSKVLFVNMSCCIFFFDFSFFRNWISVSLLLVDRSWDFLRFHFSKICPLVCHFWRRCRPWFLGMVLYNLTLTFRSDSNVTQVSDHFLPPFRPNNTFCRLSILHFNDLFSIVRCAATTMRCFMRHRHRLMNCLLSWVKFLFLLLVDFLQKDYRLIQFIFHWLLSISATTHFNRWRCSFSWFIS